MRPQRQISGPGGAPRCCLSRWSPRCWKPPLWRLLAAIGAARGRLPLIAAIDRLSPPAVILVVLLPFVPVVSALNLGAIWPLTHGHDLWAGAVILGTKVFGAAVSTCFFTFARPKLRQLRCFAWGVFRSAAC